MIPVMQDFVIRLPQDVIEMVERTAQERHQSVEEVVAEELRFSLQPLEKTALQNLRTQVKRQQNRTKSELLLQTKRGMKTSQKKRLADLLEKNREVGLSGSEPDELQSLFDQVEAVATEKAAAISLLLKRQNGFDEFS